MSTPVHTLQALRAAVRRLRTTLEFYASPTTYHRTPGASAPISEDAGHRARAALATLPEHLTP